MTKTDKITWWGCGKHIPKVMDQVPENDRCTCTPQVEVDGKKYPPKGDTADLLSGRRCLVM